LGAFVLKKSTASFFAPLVARTAPRGRVSQEFFRPKPKLQKRTTHEIWDKRGGLGAFISKKSTASFFAPQVARTTLGGGFRTSFIDRNQNFENTLHMSFGSNGVDWMRSFRKKSTACFFAPQVARTALAGGFRMSFVDRNRNFKNAPNMSFGSNGVDWVRSFRKNQLQLFRSTSGQNGPRGRVSHEFCRPKLKL
jgi:hypothetical protein